jgi:hypothetical protein
MRSLVDVQEGRTDGRSGLLRPRDSEGRRSLGGNGAANPAVGSPEVVSDWRRPYRKIPRAAAPSRPLSLVSQSMDWARERDALLGAAGFDGAFIGTLTRWSSE